MKILVTGATGFIGAAVARKLSQQGYEVVALSRSDAAAAKLRAAGLTPIAGDFAVPASLAAPAAQVDAVVSTASIGQRSDIRLDRGPSDGTGSAFCRPCRTDPARFDRRSSGRPGEAEAPCHAEMDAFNELIDTAPRTLAGLRRGAANFG